MTGTNTQAPAWELPPAEPDVFKNFAGYLHGLQSLKVAADDLGNKMEDDAGRGINPVHVKTFLQELGTLSDHLGELIFRMDDDNFFPVGPEHDLPLAEAKERALIYIKAHPGTPDHIIKWLLRCTYELADRIVAELLGEGVIKEQEGGFVVR